MMSRILGVTILMVAQFSYAEQTPSTTTTSGFVVADTAVTNVRTAIPISELSIETIQKNCKTLAEDVVNTTPELEVVKPEAQSVNLAN